jgi:hypothetical protein
MIFLNSLVKNKNRLLTCSFLIFILSRIIIYFMYGSTLIDTSFYAWAADAGILKGAAAYKDFSFPYPPFSLPFIYLPYLFDLPSILSYRNVFRLEMMFFDFLCVVFIYLFLRNRLKYNDNKICLAILLYSLLGLLIGHLLYERMDIVIAAIFVGIIYYYTDKTTNRPAVYGLCIFGILFKIMPIFFIPIIFLTDLWKMIEYKKLQPRVFLYPLISLCFCAAYLYLYNLSVNGKLFAYLLEHNQRGIQIESLWASPILLLASFTHIEGFQILYNYGALHITDKVIPPLYLCFSKYTGFVILVIFFIYYAYLLLDKKLVTRNKAKIFFLANFVVLLILISFQRVLSPQFLIWCLPGFCIISVGRRKYFFILAIILYLLTYFVYDIGFIKLHNMNLLFIIITFIRNPFLVFITVFVFYKYFRKRTAS